MGQNRHSLDVLSMKKPLGHGQVPVEVQIYGLVSSKDVKQYEQVEAPVGQLSQRTGHCE